MMDYFAENHGSTSNKSSKNALLIKGALLVTEEYFDQWFVYQGDTRTLK